MRTEVIDQACERFRHRLEERLGKGFEVGSPRVAFDSAGRHVRAPVLTPLGELAFRSSLLDEEGGSFGWSFDGERGLAERWRASTDIARADRMPPLRSLPCRIHPAPRRRRRQGRLSPEQRDRAVVRHCEAA